MRIAIASEDNKGLEGTVSAHFGRCPYYVLVDADSGKIGNVQAIQSPFYGGHGEGDVPNFIQVQGAKVMISGGMGPKAIGYFNQFGIEVATGASGKVGDAVRNYLDGGLYGSAPCRGGDNLSGLKQEAELLQRKLSEIQKGIEQLERENR
jgi:predicted Fe-Mo cluster-binding NifX family protein